MQDNKFWALYYLKEQKWSVIPVGTNRKGQHGKKAPFLDSWKEYQDRLPTEDEVTEWWTKWPDAKIGVLTGQVSNLVVVDVDDPVNFPKTNIELPDTLRVKTGKGWHFYYKSTERVDQTPITYNGKQVGDLKAEGGYVIAPPSSHHSEEDVIDGAYEWFKMPGEIAIADFKPISNTSSGTSTGIVKKDFTQLASGVRQGERNNMAASFIGNAIRVLPQHKWASEAWPSVVAWNMANTPPLEEEELRTVFNSICSKENKSVEKTDFNATKASELREKEPVAFPWLVDGLIPEKAITVIAGDTGCGKSLFSLYLAEQVSTGEQLLRSFDTKQTNVLYLDREMVEEDYIERTKLICSKQSNVFLAYENKFKIDNKLDFEALGSFLKDNNIGLVIFDTLSKIHNEDENSNTEITKIMEKILYLCNDYNTTVILIHHHNKNKEADGYGRGRGASAIPDNCASYLTVKSLKERREGKDILCMSIEQNKSRRKSSVMKFGIDIFETVEESGHKMKFMFKSEAMLDNDKVNIAKQAVYEYINYNAGATLNAIKNHLKDVKNIEKRDAGTAIEYFKSTGEIMVVDGANNSKKHFINNGTSQDNIL